MIRDRLHCSYKYIIIWFLEEAIWKCTTAGLILNPSVNSIDLKALPSMPKSSCSVLDIDLIHQWFTLIIFSGLLSKNLPFAPLQTPKVHFTACNPFKGSYIMLINHLLDQMVKCNQSSCVLIYINKIYLQKQCWVKQSKWRLSMESCRAQVRK